MTQGSAACASAQTCFDFIIHLEQWTCRKEPPVGFEPTTSRLLSGCSTN